MTGMSSALGEIATEASLERTTFLASAGEQLKSFLAANRQRIKAAGGIWRPRQRLWQIDWRTVRELGLQKNVIDDRLD